MKKNGIIPGLILLFVALTITRTSGLAEQRKFNFKMPIWERHKTLYAQSGTLVTIYIGYNPSTSQVVSVTAFNEQTQTEIGIVETSGTISHSGTDVIATGYRVNFEPPGADYAVLSGVLDM